jgi:hypothetical protein
MKRRRVQPRRTAGEAVEASSGSIVFDNNAAYNNNDHASAFAVANLPKIPGVPIEHIPPFLHILRVSSKFFHTERTKRPFTIVDWEMLNDNNDRSCIHDLNPRDGIAANENTTVPQTIHDSIMDRMKASTSKTPENDSDDFQKKFVEAVNNWMNDVEILARRRKKPPPTDGALATTTTATMNSGNKQQLPETENTYQSIPYSMFLYLWEMQQQHKRATVRRSALFLSGLLLLRSKDCRSYLDQETHLADWVSNIGVRIDGNASTSASFTSTRDRDASEARKHSNRKMVQHAFLQKEAIALVSHLVDKGYGRMYAKLGVAAKSLRHRCTTTSSLLDEPSDSVTTPPGMANWRKLRDFALRHGPKEIQKVRKLLDRADECLEILVPRIDGVRRPSPFSITTTTAGNGPSVSGEKQSNANGDGEEDSSDEDDIDWEDGNEIDTNGATSAKDEPNVHLSAVEITMAAMEQTGSTLFSGGALEIDFDRRVEEDDECGNNDGGVSGTNDNNPSSNLNQAARGKLETIVQKLSNRHLVRLSAWLDGLRNSDNLVVRVESASLVSLSPRNNNLRLELIDRLTVLRQDVSTVVSSASRLNIGDHDKEPIISQQAAPAGRSVLNLVENSTASDVVSPAERVLQAVSNSSTSARAELSKKRTLKKKNKKNRFRRIQINYKK